LAGRVGLRSIRVVTPEPPATPPAGIVQDPLGPVADGGGIQLRGVRKSFGDISVLEGIDLEIGRHARIGIVGPSGGGKSTLLSIVAGLLEPDAGEVVVDGARMAKARLRSCALMPQRDLLLPWRSALDNACLALENRGVSRRQARERARPLFERFGLARFESRQPNQLSGGMRQRVSFLRTLLADKDVLLLDEPFGALDSITRAQMQEWLSGALEEVPRTVLLVTHDVEEALLLAGRIVVLSARPGRIVRAFDTTFPRLGTRRETVSQPEFVALREEALEALEC
jgi:NitT/TauT family transport system ATP-binding protein